MQIEKIDFYDSFYNEEDVSDSFAEEFVFDEKSETENNNLTIIGHPVMIGDVLEWIENNILNDEDIEYQYQYIFRYWLGKHLPITEQSDECVKFVYNLISE